MALNFGSLNLRTVDKKKLGIIALAIFAGLIAMILTNTYIEQTSMKKAEKMAGSFTGAETQKLFSRIETLERASQELATGQMTLAQNQAAQAQAPATKPPPQSSLGMKTPVGKRAITAMVDRINAVGGMVTPGDRVDVIAHLSIPSTDTTQTKTVTVTLFQNVLVLAMGTNTQTGTTDASANTPTIPVTFALDPQEAGLISFAQEHGHLQLVLRPPQENQSYIVPAATWESLAEYIKAIHGTDEGVKPSEKAEAPVGPRIEVYRGGQ